MIFRDAFSVQKGKNIQKFFRAETLKRLRTTAEKHFSYQIHSHSNTALTLKELCEVTSAFLCKETHRLGSSVVKCNAIGAVGTGFDSQTDHIRYSGTNDSPSLRYFFEAALPGATLRRRALPLDTRLGVGSRKFDFLIKRFHSLHLEKNT